MTHVGTAGSELSGEMGPFGSDEYTPQALVSPWPAVEANGTFGWAVHHRLASWAQAQARWLGQRAIGDRSRGTAALGAATLW
eukprot:3950995-Alexandrium_andersonii.AAC.1